MREKNNADQASQQHIASAWQTDPVALDGKTCPKAWRGQEVSHLHSAEPCGQSPVCAVDARDWAASSICDLYRCRWGIEAFFKQIKQTFKVCDFLGHSKHAICWQLWAAMLPYVLLRFIVFQSKWLHSFSRQFTIVRAVVWDRFGLFELADFYGTARHRFRMCSAPQSASILRLAYLQQAVWDDCGQK